MLSFSSWCFTTSPCIFVWWNSTSEEGRRYYIWLMGKGYGWRIEWIAVEVGSKDEEMMLKDISLLSHSVSHIPHTRSEGGYKRPQWHNTECPVHYGQCSVISVHLIPPSINSMDSADFSLTFISSRVYLHLQLFSILSRENNEILFNFIRTCTIQINPFI